jgi:single-stranded-DNA-specific exonuclease
MQYKVKSLIKQDYLNTILKERGIEDPERYANPLMSDIESPLNLDNIERGYKLLEKHIHNHSKIALIVDCDCDGYTSAAIIYNFLKSYYEIDIDYYIHEGKQHGLEDQIDNLINKNYGLIIVPDAGSNDFEQQKALNDTGADILILDHHLVDDIDEDYYFNDEHTVIINNQLSKNYTNKALSGAGVTWQFCKYCEEMIIDWASEDFNPPVVNTLMDLAAVGIIGDCMDMREIENRAFSYYGLHIIYNAFLKAIVSKQSFSLKRSNNISPTGVSFFIAPLINSIVRVGTPNEKERMFGAFIDGDKVVPSTKRGARGETERLADQMAREGTNAKNRQDTSVTRAMDSIDMFLQGTGEIDNTVIIAILDDTFSFPTTLNGLVAMKLADKYKKPVLIARKNDEGFLRGSARNDGKGEFKNLRSFLIESGYFEYAQGHENAFGVSIPDKNVGKFLNYANEKLKDVNFSDNFYEVEYAAPSTDETISDFIFDVYKDDRIWGQKNDAPLIAVTGLSLSQSDIQVCGARSDTLRFKVNGITYIKFFASQDIEKLRQAGDEFVITIIGEGAINEWNGTTSPQVIIKDYEIGGTIFDF